ncbi:MAG: hypothetical protein HY828_10055 [Actinobacteria bacterium]|nr:hypothetical protein [Actinomycetota bacterium]
MRASSKRLATVAALVLSTVAASCGGDDGPTSSDFVDRVNEICRTLDNDLSDLTTPTSNAELAPFASGASKAYENALADMKALEVPSDDAVVADAKGLVANFDDQVTTLDDIAAAATADDQATIDSNIATFETLSTDNADLAEGLGAERCALDPLFAFEVAPPVTDPPVTEPVDTTPVDTTPAPTTPVSSTNKTIEPLAADLAPAQGFTFVESDQAVVETFISVIDSSPTIAAVPGMVAGVDVVDSSGITTTRIFIYLPETTLPAGTPDELLPIVTDGNPTTPGTYGILAGVSYTDGDKFYFLGTDTPEAANLLMWAISTDTASLDTAIGAFTFALAQ